MGAPHENLPITQREIENIINTAKKMESKSNHSIRLCIIMLYSKRNESLYNGLGCLSWGPSL